MIISITIVQFYNYYNMINYDALICFICKIIIKYYNLKIQYILIETIKSKNKNLME